MIDLNRLCFSCMEEKGEHRICPHCSAIDAPKQPFPLLPLGSTVGGRYYIGKALAKNSEGATYIAFDTKEQRRCTVREFFPESLAVRGEDTVSVLSQPGSEAAYEECRDAFNEMWRKLMRLKGLSAMITVADVFAADNTSYAVYEEVGGKTLADHLKSLPQGYMEWDQARILFMPVLSTLGTLHTSGVIHKGISPESFLLTDEGRLKLTDFCIPQVRLAYGDLDADIAEGYAPLECYAEDGSIGPWTDIYAFAAVLYRALIGTKPIPATVRAQKDKMMIPAIFAEKLPPYVINALIKAMQINAADRTPNVEQLRANLSASPGAVTATAGVYGGAAALNLPAGELRKAPSTVAPAAGRAAARSAAADAYADGPARPEPAREARTAARPAPYADRQQELFPSDGRVSLVDDLTEDDGRRVRASNRVYYTDPAQAGDGAPASYDRLSDAAQDALDRQKKASGERKMLTALLVLLVVVLLVGAALVFNAVMSDKQEKAAQTTQSQDQTRSVPVFTGESFEKLQSDQNITSFFSIQRVDKYSTTDENKGKVIDQSINATTVVSRGTVIVLTVDAGRKAIRIPDLSGRTYQDAVSILQNEGLNCIKGSELNDGTHMPDTVACTRPEAGSVLYTGDSIQILLWTATQTTPEQNTENQNQNTNPQIPTDDNGNPVISDAP